MIKNHILKILKATLGKLDIKETGITIEKPANPDFGDYATSIALKLAKTRKKKPLQIAEDIVKNLPKDDLIEKAEVVKPGFINFWITKKYLLAELKKIVEVKKDYGKNISLKAKRIVVEFTDPNPFKEFHIGHLYSNIVGESLCRIWESNGAIVRRVNYQGDVGLHVAKSIWGLQKKIRNDKLSLEDLSKKSIEERVKFLGQSYALGARAYEENSKAKEEIILLNKLIYDRDKSIENLYQTGRTWSLKYFETIYNRLGTKFDGYYFERDVGEVGSKIVKENLKKGIFVESQSAVIFPGENYGLHNRVFINSLGLPTYEAKELGLAPTKYKDWPYDESYIVTGNEIVEYFKVLIKALTLIFPDLGKKTYHIGHGMVRLSEGKMSSRTGQVLTGEWLLEETKKKVLDLTQKNEKLGDFKKEDIAENVSLAAVKYSFLKTNIGRDVIFNFKESLSLEGNSGPYLLYTYVRTQSVLRKAESMNVSINRLIDTSMNVEEKILLRSLINYSEIVYEAAKNFAPNLIANYLYDLAQKFNLFYQKHKILEADEKIRNFRLLLTKATGQVIKNGLYLLGIKTVEKM